MSHENRIKATNNLKDVRVETTVNFVKFFRI